MIQTFDFEYHLGSGKSVIVEVDYYYSEPDSSSFESDWDYNGGLLIDAIRFYSDTVEILGDDIGVSVAEIAFQFRKHMEDLELQYIMENNESF